MFYVIDSEAESKAVVDLIRAGMHPSEAVSLSRTEAITLIREALKKRSGKTWSVTGGKGTAWGWITVTAPPKRRVEGGYAMSEADCIELGELLSLGHPAHCQGETIPASGAYRMHYVALAMGLESLTDARPYWD